MTDENNHAAHCYRGVHVAAAAVGQRTIIDLLAERVARDPDAPFMTEVSTTGAQRTLTFRQLDELTMRCAGWLRGAGVDTGATVGLVPKNDLRSVVAIFGTLRAGGKIAFLDPSAPPARHQAIVDALEARVVVRSVDDPHGIAARTLPDLADLPAAVGTVATESAADAFYFGTSGSTATSKIVAQTHRATVSNALAVREHHGLAAGDRFLSCLPIHHVNGLHFTVMATVACGSHAILVQGFDAGQFPKLLGEYAPRIASVVPSLLQALLVTWRGGRLPSGFDAFVSAAAPLPRDVARQVWDRWRGRILQGYGLTETTNFSTTLPRTISDAAYLRQMLEPEIPTIGVEMPGNEVTVIDGEICARGHNVMDRYVGNDDETALAFRDGWFHTGDLGVERRDPELNAPLIVITGRAKNMAKVRGEAVSLDEMERLLLVFPGIRDAACTSVPDKMLGEAIIAALVGADEVPDTVILAHLRTAFAESSLPRELVRVAAIPRTPTGKVLRPQLREFVATLLVRGNGR